MGSSLIQGELWGAKAEDWAFGAEPCTQPLWDAVLEACKVGSKCSLLDLGCGAGGLCVNASALGAAVFGLDASEALINIARDRLPQATFKQGDLESVPFSNSLFDVVTACNSIQFADDQVRSVQEAKRVLKPGGRFGIGMWCEPDRCDMKAIFMAQTALAPSPPSNGPPQPTLSERQNLVALVESGGFSVVDEGEVECIFRFAGVEEALRAFCSPGMSVAVSRMVGEEQLRRAMRDAVEPFSMGDQGVRMSNWFRYVIAV